MTRLASVLSVMAVVAASSASAAEYRGPLFPTPVLPGPAAVSFQAVDAPPAEAAPMEAVPMEAVPADAIHLFECVKYEDLDHIAPCAEEKIVKVADPCWRPDPCACCQKPSCVYVRICVPKQTCCNPAPSCCAPVAPCCDQHPKVTCKDGGRYVKYDYGKYRVEIRVKNNMVVVDYDN